MLGFGWSVTDQVGQGGQNWVGLDVFRISEFARGNSAEAGDSGEGVKLGEMSQAGREDSGRSNGGTLVQRLRTR